MGDGGCVSVGNGAGVTVAGTGDGAIVGADVGDGGARVAVAAEDVLVGWGVSVGFEVGEGAEVSVGTRVWVASLVLVDSSTTISGVLRSSSSTGSVKSLAIAVASPFSADGMTNTKMMQQRQKTNMVTAIPPRIRLSPLMRLIVDDIVYSHLARRTVQKGSSGF